MDNELINQPLPPEGQRIEYKRTSTQPEIFARTIASFANTEGGKIIIGVNDDSSIVGLTEEEIGKTQLAIEKAQRLLRPRPHLNSRIEELEGKSLLVIEVQKYPTPVLTDNGRFYVRKGALSIDELEALIQALADKVPTAKSNILKILGVYAQDKVKVEETVQFNKVVHKRIEEEPNLRLNESLSKSIDLTRDELFNERGDRIQAGVVTSVSSIVSGIVSGLAFTFNKQVNDRLDGTAKELVFLERMHTAMEYISYIKDVKVRDEALSDLAKNLSAKKQV